MNVQPHSSDSSPSSSRSRPRDHEAKDRSGSISGKFQRTARLLRHADFQRVYKQGRRHFASHMTVFYLLRPAIHRPCYEGPAGPRIGFTVGRVLGGAVERNRIKRRMREAVRANLGLLTADVDVVINPKKSALSADFSALQKEITRAFSVVQENETKSRQ